MISLIIEQSHCTVSLYGAQFGLLGFFLPPCLIIKEKTFIALIVIMDARIYRETTWLMIDALINPFWNYSLKLYAHEEIKSLCLSLQDSYKANVNIVLWCCWYATEKGLASQELIEEILMHNTPWQQHVTCQLRQIRQWLKNNQSNELVEPYRQQILQLEITSEAFQQQQLYEFSMTQKKTDHNKMDAVRVNLQRYFTTLSAAVSEHHWHLITTRLLKYIEH